MKQFASAIVAALFLTICSAPDALAKSSAKASKSSGGTHHVRGYAKKDGSHVSAHSAKNPTRSARRK